MFRLILRLKQSSSKGTVRFLRVHSKSIPILSENDKKISHLKEQWIKSGELTELNDNLSDQFKILNEKKLNQQLTKSTTEAAVIEPTADDALRSDLKNCENLNELLNLIQPKLSEFKTDQLDIVFDELHNLFYTLSFKQIQTAGESSRLLQNSVIFRTLLSHTNELIDQLNVECLCRLFETLIVVRINQSDMIENTLQKLADKLNEFELDHFTLCLKVISYMPNNELTNQLIRFKQDLMKSYKTKISEHQIDSNDVEHIANVFAFLAPNTDPNFEITDHLARQLLKPDIEINFRQSVKLLGNFQKSFNLFTYRAKKRRIDDKDAYPIILSQLIDKCNLAIFDTFYSEPTVENFNYYLLKVHSTVCAFNYQFKNFYDPKLLRPLTEFLLEHNEAIDIRLIFFLIRNYSKKYEYDERLIKLLYELLFERDTQKDVRLYVDDIYNQFSQHRLPFVNHQELASKLLSDSSNDRLRKKVKNKMKLLIELILNDVNDEKLLNSLCEVAENSDQQSTGYMDIYEFKRIALSKVYLSMFSELKDDDLKFKIKNGLNNLLDQYVEMEKQPKISSKYFRIDSRLATNGYLSNGIYLESFAIYDKQKNDLVCLKKYRNYFDKVDRIPIYDGQQEIVTFLAAYRLKGNVPNYEMNYNYQLKKVLNKFKIKPVDIFIDDFMHLKVDDQVAFSIKKALDSYKIV